MTAKHRLMAIAVAVIWGANFLAIHASLEQFPPMLCGAIRFALLAIPTLLFVPRPQVPVRWLIGYGLGFGFLQFVFLYLAMDHGMPPGLASLVLQSSAPFTVLFGTLLLKERLSTRQLVGLTLALSGLALVALPRTTGASALPFILTLCGGASWALGNLAARKAAAPAPLHFMLWMTVVPVIPFTLASLLMEGPAQITHALSTSLSAQALPAWVGIGYTVIVATIVGSGMWSWLLSRHPASQVAPFSMLVPVTGMSLAWLMLGETPAPIEVIGGAIVITGVLVGAGALSRIRARVRISRTGYSSTVA